MKNVDDWRPSKFVFNRGRLIANRDTNEVSISSRLMADRIAAVYQEYLPKYIHGRLLDLGCGKVPFFEAYRSLITENICVDWPGSLHGTDFIDVPHDLNQPLPFKDNEFCCILLSDVLEHLPDPVACCGEMYRVLQPGGYCLLNVPFFYWLHEVPHDYYRFTSFALTRLFEKAGFQVVHMEAIGGSPEVFSDMVAKHACSIPLIGRTIAWGVQSCASSLGRTAIGKRLSVRTSKSFPFGYFSVIKKPAIHLNT